MKSGNKYVHFSECIDERDILNAMKSNVVGLETYNGGFATYNRADIERIEIHGNEKVEEL